MFLFLSVSGIFMDSDPDPHQHERDPHHNLLDLMMIIPNISDPGFPVVYDRPLHTEAVRSSSYSSGSKRSVNQSIMSNFLVQGVGTHVGTVADRHYCR